MKWIILFLFSASVFANNTGFYLPNGAVYYDSTCSYSKLRNAFTNVCLSDNGTGPYLPLSGGSISGPFSVNNGTNAWNGTSIGATPPYTTGVAANFTDGSSYGQLSLFSQGNGYWNLVNFDGSGNMEGRIAFGNDATISASESSGSSIVLGGSGGGISGEGYNFLRVSQSQGPGGHSDGVQIGDDSGANLSIVQGEVYVNGGMSAPTNQAFYVVSNNFGNTFSVDPNNDIVSMSKISSDGSAFTSDGSGNVSATSFTAQSFVGGGASFSSGSFSSTVTLSSLTAHGNLALNSSKQVVSIAPGTSGNALVSNGTDWISSSTINASSLSGNTFASPGPIGGTTAGTGAFTSLSSAISSSLSTGTVASLSSYPTINQSSSAGYQALWISPYEQATGSGNKYLIDAGTNTAAGGSGTHTTKFNVTDAGVGYLASQLGIGIAPGTYKLNVSGGDVLFSNYLYAGGFSVGGYTLLNNYGLIMSGDTTHPAKINTGSFLVGYSATGQAWGTNNLYVAGKTYLGASSDDSSTGQLQVTGAVAIDATQSVVNCSTSGTVTFSQPLVGTSKKEVMAYANACLGTASYTYAKAFTNTPFIPTTNSLGASLATSVSTSAVTITGATSTGFLTLEGY